MDQFNQGKKKKINKNLAILVEYISPHLVLRSESSRVCLKTTWDQVSLRVLSGLIEMTQIWLGDPGSYIKHWNLEMTAWEGNKRKRH